MGTVKRCVHKQAKNPYYVEATGIHLYSIEELAYYLHENIYLVDEDIIGEKLYAWIDRELHLGKLAERLREGNHTGIHVYNQVMNILQASEYYSEEELSRFSEKTAEISGLQTQERMKYKGDELLHNGNYWAAIMEYEKIIRIRQNSRLNVEFYGDVWNNLAVCYSRLFLFQKAAASFESAYQFQKIPEYKAKAYYARKLSEYKQRETEGLLEIKVPEEFQELSKKVLKELEEKSREECEKMIAEEFLKTREKESMRNSRI